MRLTIPRQVLYHWSERLAEIDALGVTQPTDATYAKVCEARKTMKIVRIDADADDLREILEECAGWLDDQTSVSTDPEDVPIRDAYRKLRQDAGRLLEAHDRDAGGTRP